MTIYDPHWESDRSATLRASVEAKMNLAIDRHRQASGPVKTYPNILFVQLLCYFDGHQIK